MCFLGVDQNLHVFVVHPEGYLICCKYTNSISIYNARPTSLVGVVAKCHWSSATFRPPGAACPLYAAADVISVTRDSPVCERL